VVDDVVIVGDVAAFAGGAKILRGLFLLLLHLEGAAFFWTFFTF
jgi:hypothetical protein